MKGTIKRVSRDLFGVSLWHFSSKLRFHSIKAMSALANSENCTSIVWMDLEMTGLNVKKDKILELACIITDKDLNILAEGPNIVINQSNETLNNMNDWCKIHHNESGLVQESLNSKITNSEAESILLDFLRKNVPERKCPLAGSSIYMDRFFLMEHMPRLNEYLHYRIIDVSTIKELCLRWNNKVLESTPKKRLVHRSLDDIKESIRELKYYQDNLFKLS